MSNNHPGGDPSAIDEPPVVRWKRRAVSVPTMLGATVVAFATAPLIAASLAVADLLSRRTTLPRVRIFGVTLQYLFNDSVEIVAAPLLWVAAGFGRRLDSARSRHRHFRLQRWSLTTLARRADSLLGLRIDIDGVEQCCPAPAIVLCRHVSVVDASLPALLYDDESGIHVRGVIMSAMLADPGFDLLYRRLGSVFIDRDRGDDARLALRSMGEELDTSSVAAVFPEGRLFDPTAKDRALARLADSDPARAERLAPLRHLLPPRPGGVLALLEGAPTADVVIVGHTGFETIPSLSDLGRRAHLEHPISVSVRRVPRRDVPDDAEAQIEWLDSEWLALDRRIDDELAGFVTRLPPAGHETRVAPDPRSGVEAIGIA